MRNMRSPAVPEPCDHVVHPDAWERGGMTSCDMCGQPVELGLRERTYTGPPICWNDGTTMRMVEGRWACQDPTSNVTGPVLDV